MNVSTLLPFRIVYSLYDHEYLGYQFEAYAVQVDGNNRLTLKHQHVSSKNMREFASRLNDTDYKLIELMDKLHQDTIVKKFHEKKIKTEEFFLKTYHKEKGDEVLQGLIEEYVEGRKAQILELLKGKLVFEMGKDGEPTWKKLDLPEEKATVLFHFRRNEDNTHYFPTIKHLGEKLEFQYKNAIIINNKPAWLLLNGKLYSFAKEVDGKKLKPFLNKNFIEIPRKIEESYYEKFVAPLVASFDVYAKGFEINTEHHEPRPVLTFSELQIATRTMSLFGNSSADVLEEEEENKIVFDFSFQYGSYVFSSDNPTLCSVKMEKTQESYIFHRVRRSLDWEKEQAAMLKSMGLELRFGKYTVEKSRAFTWLKTHSDFLVEKNFLVRQHAKDEKRYFVGASSINLEIRENNDWFDVHAIVRFGEFEIPFIKLRKTILAKKKEFVLPNGEIAVIPEEWFTQYSDLFNFVDEDETNLRLKKHHLALVQELSEDSLAQVQMNRRLEKLKEFESIDDYPVPTGFKGELRPYQKAGFNWMNFLADFKLGGCLADDMGLGKTVQTLATLLRHKESGNGTSLLVVPTSLIYNWEQEARKFTPDLKVYNYTGTYRDKNIEKFAGYDLVVTSYGTVRIDADLLQKYYFNYVILDESQAIKNPTSGIAQEIKKLSSRHKLILTGTPIENSTMDLWSQMNFVNPGLLGAQSFFRNEFLLPIEKKNDEDKTKKLYRMIKPFILRRQKNQVAKELPEKIENVRYCQMSEEQESEYEKVKSFYRNQILEEIELKGVGSSQFLVIQGLTRLRQIANHPRLVDQDFAGSAGKFEEVVETLEEGVANGHKILVFSQFVKHLSLFREYLDQKQLKYNYLDGSTRDRQEQVEEFQNNEDIRIFLISLKAGGTGLNLTAADYVFLLDPWWNPAAEAQAIDRAHRIGQTNTVFTYKFITKNTVEEKILLLQKAKLKLAGDLISTDEGMVKHLTKEDITNLFD